MTDLEKLSMIARALPGVMDDAEIENGRGVPSYEGQMFALVVSALEGLAARVGYLDRRLGDDGQMTTWAGTVDSRFEGVEDRTQGHDERLTNLEDRLRRYGIP